MEYRDYFIKGDGKFSMLSIKNKQGPVPEKLRGLFSTIELAKKQIDLHYATLPVPRPVKRKLKDGSASISGSD